ncbi:hypothetical protein ABGB18_42485 [Nonomuraea sp. B12E4]|uniref:hypothetical protein n=1 Tax=Nonomuraea sp. B12E4 TaxID=3153564 RepID=UPI00325EB4EB
MTHGSSATTLSPDVVHNIQTIAAAWRSRGLDRDADNLLIGAGLTTPTPSNVFRLSDYRPSRQAVSR